MHTSTPLPTRSNHPDTRTVADIDAVREFLVSGRAIPPAPPTGRAKPHGRTSAPVAFHNGIVRARTRSAAKG